MYRHTRQASRIVEEQIGAALDDLDPEVRRRSEIAAEDVVIAHETARGFECERVGHLKIGFDIRSIGPADPQTGYRDPVTGIRRIEVKGRRRGQPIRLTTNEWYAEQPERESQSVAQGVGTSSLGSGGSGATTGCNSRRGYLLAG
ncbi:MAG: DUF3883 domain-containing protein [Acidobacteriia bacterium]|nr:DUF3883 domain-containing protein [Terriglobia bacterium]